MKQLIVYLMERPFLYTLAQNLLNGSGHKLIKKYLKKNIPGQMSVLDQGCGSGEYSLIFTNYTGLDNNPKDIEYARQKYEGEFILGDASRMTQIKDNSFDAVFAIGLHHHLNDNAARKAITEAIRVTKKAGRIIIIDAMRPKHRWNLYGLCLRKLDRGGYVRSYTDTLKLLSREIKFGYRIISAFPLDFICINITK